MLLLVGINYRSAPLDLRERIAYSEDELADVLPRLIDGRHASEGWILSTCNRVELLVRTDLDPDEALPALESFLASDRGIDLEQLRRHRYHFTEREAVEHLFKVATGIDSMILGEPQILGQVKQAYLAARRAGTTRTVTERLAQQCLATAKRVRTESGIARNAVSVAFAAAGLARQIFGRLEDRTALVLGAGKMGELVARHLVTQRTGRLMVASRTFCRSVVSAQRVGATAIQMDEGLKNLTDVDVLVTCTGAPGVLVDRDRVVRALRGRRGRPLCIIDIAVPRDVDAAVDALDNVYLYDIDGLQSVVDANLEERKAAAREAVRQIARAVDSFFEWRQSLEITPTIVAMRERFEELAVAELRRLRRRRPELTAAQLQASEELFRGLLKKILHDPIRHLRDSVRRGDTEACTSSYREIFNLEPRGANDRRHPGRTRADGPRRILDGGKDGSSS